MPSGREIHRQDRRHAAHLRDRRLEAQNADRRGPAASACIAAAAGTGPADHAAFARQYGAGDDAIAAVTAFAAAHALTVAHVDQKRRVIELAGSVADMENAFGTQLDDYAIGRQSFRGRRGPLLLPTTILPHVEAVLGLDNRPVAKPRMQPRAAQPGFYPQQLAALYRFPKGDGTGQTIALIELGGNYGAQDSP